MCSDLAPEDEASFRSGATGRGTTRDTVQATTKATAMGCDTAPANTKLWVISTSLVIAGY